MEAEEYKKIIQRIKTNCKNLSIGEIKLKRVNEDEFSLTHPHWHEEILLSRIILMDLIQVGYFNSSNKIDIDKMLLDEEMFLLLNKHMLFKTIKGLGINELLIKSSLYSGIFVLLLSVLLFLSNSNSIGYIKYTKMGKFSSNSYLSFSWYHFFVIGIFLIIFSFFYKFTNKKEKN